MLNDVSKFPSLDKRGIDMDRGEVNSNSHRGSVVIEFEPVFSMKVILAAHF
jgi:hypothetical protein